jgi:hypothetical protein
MSSNQLSAFPDQSSHAPSHGWKYQGPVRENPPYGGGTPFPRTTPSTASTMVTRCAPFPSTLRITQQGFSGVGSSGKTSDSREM